MKRSGRCDACKKSKVKCDEGLPQCQKCIKSGKVCPGYPSETKFAFRDMTGFAEQKVESRVQDILKARDSADQGLSMPLEVTEWQEKAVARFFADYVLDSDAVPSTTVCLPGLYSISDAGACLKDAVYAAAFANQGNHLGLEWIAIEAKEAYGRALVSLARALQDPVEALKDTTLATAFVIGLYEAISGYLPTGTLMDYHHHRGRVLLMRLRGNQQLSSPISRCLFNILHEQAVSHQKFQSCLNFSPNTHSTLQITKCLVRHEKPMEESNIWNQALGTKVPSRRITELSIHTAHVCALAQNLFDSSEHGKEWESGLLELIKDAIAIDLLYQDWIDKYSVSKTWGYQILCLFPDEALPADGVVQVHHDFYTAYIWNSCRGKRAHLLEVTLRCLSLLGCHPKARDLSSKLKGLDLAENLLTHFKYIIEDMVSSICATVPFLLGDIDLAVELALERKSIPLAGFMLLWTLHVVRASTNQGSERDAWIRRRYEFIDSKMGIRYGRLMANKIMKEPWNLS